MSAVEADVAAEIVVPIYIRAGTDGDLCHIGDLVGTAGQDESVTRREAAVFLRECADILERRAPDAGGGS